MPDRHALCLLILIAAAGCSRPASTPPADATLRIAVSSGRTSASAPGAGIRQIAQSLSLEALASLSDDGRVHPSVAAGWTVSDDMRVVRVALRPKLQYQDGTPVTAADVVAMLQQALPRDMGPAFEDIEAIEVANSHEVAIRFRRPSGFRLELLEVTVQKPADRRIGTGAYAPIAGSNTELIANENYYLGKPFIRHVQLQTYPSFRSAWADMLRGRTDMLFEVGVDALESLENARNVARLFTFRRRYQYLIVLNTDRQALRSSTVRRALNAAIDRDALLRDSLNGRGEASTGPVPPRHWAIAGIPVPKVVSSPSDAAAMLRTQTTPLRFTCLVVADYERIALVVKHQLAAVGVDMALEQVTTDQLLTRLSRHDFDAFLVDAVSGPTMYRLYRFWHSGETFNPAGVGSPTLDVPLDEIRHAGSDAEYRAAVLRFQSAALDDPPAIFLAWGEAARAVSVRFDVPEDPERPDVMATLRLWRSAASPPASRN